MSAAAADDLDLALRALADANRRAILASIRTGSRPVGAIADEVGLSQQTTSHHLSVLRDAGLASSTRDGTRHLYAINTDGLAAARDYLDGFWPVKLAALKAAVEANANPASDAPAASDTPDASGATHTDADEERTYG